jgi:hypothetical protein
MAGIFEFDPVAGNNVSIGGVGCGTGMSPANVDNVIREMAAAIATSFAEALENFLNGTAALPVANGGTGAATSAAALTALGALEDDYRDLPITSKSAAFTFANSERANGILYTGSAAAATINPNATTAINTGAVYVIRNAGSGALTLTRGAGVTLLVNGGTASANGTLAVGGVCSLTKWATNTWTAVGSGLS